MDSIKTIRNNVALNCSTYSDIKPIDFVALIIVELLGYVKSLNSCKDSQDFKRLIGIVNDLHEFVGRQRFTKESLLRITQETFLDKYSIAELSAIVGKVAFFEFPDTLDRQMGFKTVSTNPPKLRDNYGTKEYAPSVENPSVNSEEVSSNSLDIHSVQVTGNQTTKDIQSSSFVQNIATYNNRPTWDRWSRLYTSNKDKEYFWQWRVCKEDYDSLKSFLQSTLKNLSKREALKHYCHQISLFCAEWYKREYSGYGDGPKPAFSAIGCDHFTNFACDLCERSRITLRGNNRYVNSLYAQGGLPWKYIISNEDANLARSIGQVFKAIKNNQTDNIENIASAIHNSTIRESYINRGSIHANLNVLLEDSSYEEYILSEFPDELDRKNIKNFIRGLKREIVRYFSIIWRLDQRSRDTLVPMLSFSEHAKSGCIPKELLKNYNIDTDKCNKFNLVIKSDSDQNLVKFWTYYKCANGDYSTSEYFDARIIKKYEKPEDLPNKFLIYIEDIPGAFGIWGDNGFGDNRSVLVDKVEGFNIIKIYGDLDDKVLYSTPKDSPLYILKRDFITAQNSSDINIINLGNFDFFYIDKPTTLIVNGDEKIFSPYGRVNIILNSTSLLSSIDVTNSEIQNKEIKVNVQFDKRVVSALLVSHKDLEDIQFSLGDLTFEEELCKFYYNDINDKIIDDIEGHFGYAHLYVEYGTKQAEISLYLLDVERDITSSNISINGTTYHIDYQHQPDCSKEFNIGDNKTGAIKINIVYPFDKKDVILICPQRKVWKSKKYLKPFKEFYIERSFGKNGYKESQLIIKDGNYLVPFRPSISRLSPQVYKLSKPAENNERFYCYDSTTGNISELSLDGNLLHIPFDNSRYRCIVFQSLKNSGFENATIYKTSTHDPIEFTSKWWEIVFEHDLLIEDWLLLQSFLMPIALVGYYEYTSNKPDMMFLRKLAKTLNFSWLLMAKWLYLEEKDLDKQVHRNLKGHFDKILPIHLIRLKEMCELGEDKDVANFIDKYVRTIKKVKYIGGGKDCTARRIAKVLAGETNFWTISKEDLKTMVEALNKPKTYKQIESYLEF